MAEYCYLFLKAASSDRRILMNHKTTWVTNSCARKKAFPLIALLVVIAILAILAALLLPAAAWAKPMVVKVVVLTTFESGASASGEAGSGEFKIWADRSPLKTPMKIPGIEGRVL